MDADVKKSEIKQHTQRVRGEIEKLLEEYERITGMEVFCVHIDRGTNPRVIHYGVNLTLRVR